MLSRPAIVMMQPADHRNCDNSSTPAWLNFALDRRVAIQGQVSSRMVIVLKVGTTAGLPFIKSSENEPPVSAQRPVYYYILHQRGEVSTIRER